MRSGVSRRLFNILIAPFVAACSRPKPEAPKTEHERRIDETRRLIALDRKTPHLPDTGKHLPEGLYNGSFTLIAGVWVLDQLYYEAVGAPLGKPPAGDDVTGRRAGSLLPKSIVRRRYTPSSAPEASEFASRDSLRRRFELKRFWAGTASRASPIANLAAARVATVPGSGSNRTLPFSAAMTAKGTSRSAKGAGRSWARARRGFPITRRCGSRTFRIYETLQKAGGSSRRSAPSGRSSKRPCWRGNDTHRQ